MKSILILRNALHSLNALWTEVCYDGVYGSIGRHHSADLI
jgi:hypothetical protein